MTQHTLQARLDALVDVKRPSDFTIATLTRYDIPALAALRIVAYGEAEVAENLWEANDEMRMTFDGAFGTLHDNSIIGAWINGTLVGAVICVTKAPLENTPDGPFVIELIVDPIHRKQGIATALLGELARRCSQWGYSSLYLQLDMHADTSSTRLYELLGFEDFNQPKQNIISNSTQAKQHHDY